MAARSSRFANWAEMTIPIRRSTAADGALLVAIWRSSVAKTHDFVNPSDLDEIDREVQRFLPQSRVWVALDDNGSPIAFMGLEASSIDSLFVANDWQGRGVGRALVDHAKLASLSLAVVVNAQNEQAVRFYRHLGFVVVGHSPTDEEGRPYPIFRMRWDRRTSE
jgi:putative acetyltransferase